MLPHTRLNSSDIIWDPVEGEALRFEVEEGVGGTRVAVARLADGAGVENEPAFAQRPGRSRPETKCLALAAGGFLKGERDVSVAHEAVAGWESEEVLGSRLH